MKRKSFQKATKTSLIVGISLSVFVGSSLKFQEIKINNKKVSLKILFQAIVECCVCLYITNPKHDQEEASFFTAQKHRF